MKIGIYGGTFNPPHYAHLKIINEVKKQFRLHKIIVVPTYISPHKIGIKSVSGYHRIKMLKLLIGKSKNIKISNYELSKKGISYSIDTLKYFKNKYKNPELYLIIGSDNLKKLNEWKDIDEIKNKSKIIVVPRKYKLKPIHSAYLRLEFEPVKISSSEIRKMILKKSNCKNLIPKNIYNYINKYNLYTKS